MVPDVGSAVSGGRQAGTLYVFPSSFWLHLNGASTLTFPDFAPRNETEGLGFRRVEVVFEAMVDADGDGSVISKEKTKLYLQAAMQAVGVPGLERWPLG